MDKVIVTGGAGFIGSHLAEQLAEQGYSVIILDDLSTGKMENIEELRKRDNIEFVLGSINDFSLLQELSLGVKYIFHQAALPSVPRSIKDPLKTSEVNITGTLNVLTAARDNGVNKVVCASSSSVYGDTPTLPKNEQMIPSPQSPYAVTKLCVEHYCQVFHQVYGLKTACLRYFNVYGPGQDPKSEYAAVIPHFITQVLQGKPPTIFGDGEQTRDFTYVRDVVAANIMAAKSDTVGVFNIGSGERITINELAKLIITVVGEKMEPAHLESRPGDVMHSLADITGAGTFGYKPKYGFAEGLKETLRWYSNE